MEVEGSSSGGSGLTLWGDNSVSLYINTANVRPNAGRYRNTFWREHTGCMEGEVLFSWYLGRGQRLSDKTTQGLIRSGGGGGGGGEATTVLLFCRKQPSRPYRFCVGILKAGGGRYSASERRFGAVGGMRRRRRRRRVEPSMACANRGE